MAFTNETLSHVGGASPAPRIYTYYTEDSQATVTATNYFSGASTKLQVNDLIHHHKYNTCLHALSNGCQ